MKSEENNNDTQQDNESADLTASELTTLDTKASTIQPINESTLRPVDFSTGSIVVIRVENLWKEYRLGTINHGTLSQDLNSWWAKLRGKEDPNTKLDSTIQQSNDSTSEVPDRFWALKDVSFGVKQGEILGIVGKNGAGKSTLLKILSQVTAPTKGQVNIKGRVASLLEVGTGFHPELTGRENVFLNGAILGMSKAEIRSKFDEIVAFAEIEKFIDTPVKRYSSGMYVRLAFAVAAHLEPEILIVDEVLAVGDAAFQKKCLGKMEEVGKEGRTVLFVSHNMAAVENLCDTGVVLDKGKTKLAGNADEAIAYYLNSFTNDQSQTELRLRGDRKGVGRVRVTKMTLEDEQGNKGAAFAIGGDILFKIDYEASEIIHNPRVILGVYDFMSAGVTRFDTEISLGLPAELSKSGTVTCKARNVSLSPGRYLVNIAFFGSGVMEDYLAGASYFDVIGSDYFKTGKVFNESDSKLAKVLFQHDWRHLS